MSAIIDKAKQLDELLHTAVQDDKSNGVFRCRRDIFTNADLFEQIGRASCRERV